MKIYTEVNYRWDGDQLVVSSEAHYEHKGEIGECKGGGNTIDESPHAVALAEIAQEKWDYYQDTFVPLENEFMAQVDAMDSEANYDKAMGMGVSEFDIQYEPQIDNKMEELRSAGAAPGSGRAIMAEANMRSEGAGTQGMVGANAASAQKDKYIKGVENVVGIGEGQSTTAMQGMSDMVRMGTDRAKQDAFNEWNETSATRSAFGTGAGMAAGYAADKLDKKA
jgi:hypothetical protein